MTHPDVEGLIERLRARFAVKEVPPCRVCGAPLKLASAGGGSLPKYTCSAILGDFSKGGTAHYRASEHYHDHGDSDVIALLDTLSAQQGRIEGLTKALEAIDLEAPSGEAPDRPSVGFQPSRDPEIDDGNDTVREAFDEGVVRGLWQAAQLARAILSPPADEKEKDNG